MPLIIALLLSATAASAQVESFTDSVILQRLRRFAPAEFTVDTSKLAPGDRRALGSLIAAGKVIEEIYLRQSWAGSPALLDSLSADTSAGGKLRRRYFMVNMSPWSNADRMRAFLPGAPEKKPLRANLYPDGMKRADWGPWFIALDSRRQAEAAGPRHVVRWDSGGAMKTVPYSEEYRDLLTAAGGLLKEAAAQVADRGTRELLLALITAFGSNDYGVSDRAAVGADGAISVTIGPTNLSLDELFRYKKAYEVVIAVRDEHATLRMKQMERSLPGIEKALGGPGPGARAKHISLRIDNAVYIGGGARAGSLASTVRLPADSTLLPSTGEKTILLRNVYERNFALIQAPIAAAVLEAGQAGDVTFDAFFLHLVMRELSRRFGWDGAVRRSADPSGAVALVDPAPALAEAKADLAGLAGIDHLTAAGTLPAALSRSLYQTQVSSLLRALRFWRDDPFVAGAAIQFSYHREQGSIAYDPRSGRYRVDVGKMKDTSRKLFSEITSLQSEGDPARLASFYERYARLSPEISALPERLADIPYDIEPVFPLAD